MPKPPSASSRAPAEEDPDYVPRVIVTGKLRCPMNRSRASSSVWPEFSDGLLRSRFRRAAILPTFFAALPPRPNPIFFARVERTLRIVR